MPSSIKPLFADRRSAGKSLAAALQRFRSDRPCVLALPRGGVPVAYEVAHALQAELDLLIVRKIGAPGQEEFGIGAVVDGADPQLVLDDEAVRQLGVSPDYIRVEAQRQLAEIERRRSVYLGSRAPVPIAGRTVILVDDGIATGSSMLAALRGVQKAGAARIVLAVPVASSDALLALRSACDEIVCLAQPDPFYAVGLYYIDFRQTTDAEVVSLLAEASRKRSEAPLRAQA
ncbi:phosphoribosyltransferase [Sphingomonas sp. MMS24-J13]|uniref:phosphoribosyltransferase n=1 Tax=Sphingomonas sp. MMS24-J13 TaxID=3238686 RepID=UPI0038516D9A